MLRKGGGMFGFGMGELLAILVIILVLFSRRLPDLGESFGAAIRRFRKAVKQSDEIDITPKEGPDKNGNK
jgi:TatA/E family protein of Tat protein translocase